MIIKYLFKKYISLEIFNAALAVDFVNWLGSRLGLGCFVSIPLSQ